MEVRFKFYGYVLPLIIQKYRYSETEEKDDDDDTDEDNKKFRTKLVQEEFKKRRGGRKVSEMYWVQFSFAQENSLY